MWFLCCKHRFLPRDAMRKRGMCHDLSVCLSRSCTVWKRLNVFSNYRRSLVRVHVPPTKVFRRLIGSVNKTMLKSTPRCSGQQAYVYVGFSRRKISRSSAERISEKVIRLRHPDYNPDRAQKVISSSMFRHLSTRNISCKYMHAFFSNLRRIKFHRNPSITSSAIALKCKNRV